MSGAAVPQMPAKSRVHGAMQEDVGWEVSNIADLSLPALFGLGGLARNGHISAQLYMFTAHVDTWPDPLLGGVENPA